MATSAPPQPGHSWDANGAGAEDDDAVAGADIATMTTALKATAGFSEQACSGKAVGEPVEAAGGDARTRGHYAR